MEGKVPFNLSQVQAAYDAMADIYAEKWCAAGAVDSELRYLQRLIELGPPGMTRILDVGCGPAVYLPLARELGLEYVGVDLAERMLRTARERFTRCSVICGDARRLPFSDATFDFSVAMNSFSHMADTDFIIAVTELARVLVPGGTLFLSDQLGNDTRVIDYPLMPEVSVPIYPRSKATYELILAESGFLVVAGEIRQPMPDEIDNDKALFWAVRRTGLST